jgi:hypothetical protein
MSDTITTTPIAEWVAEMEKRGKLDCGFVCPICGNVASPNDWRALLPDLKNPDRAARECIGRAKPREERRAAFPVPFEGDTEPPKEPESPCDYAAFGLFNICKRQVEFPDGKTVGVFEFAEASP